MKERDISIILLAGGTGSRMNSATPKQFMILQQKPILLYSLKILQQIEKAREIVIVCNPSYRSIFDHLNCSVPLKFALPGKRRQDSVSNGLGVTDPNSKIICIHDGARPFPTLKMAEDVVEAARNVGAAACAVPVKFTVKETDQLQFVIKTTDRSCLWEVQTPQAIQRDLLTRGFQEAHQHGWSVTDDVSLVEKLQKRVKLVMGSYLNLKITTPEDLLVAELLAKQLQADDVI